MPLFSLPTPYGIGSMGKEAYKFIDFLHEAGQSCWQILPEGHTGFADSPYQCFSAFAANPYFIDIEILRDNGLLTSQEARAEEEADTPGTINYGRLYKERYALLSKATDRMKVSSKARVDAFLEFQRQNEHWLSEYALFMAIKEENSGISFKEWPKPLRERHTQDIEEAKHRLKEDIYFWSALQYLFYEQWSSLKKYADEKGVGIIGDIPIYVSPDSVEEWSRPELFISTGTFVAGCPPDDFSQDGQLWGNPLYDWEYQKKTGYSWWCERLENAFSIFDEIRIDHFRGFAGYCAIPSSDSDARRGQWLQGPGEDFISVIIEKFKDKKIIAEDLGYLTSDARGLLDYSGYPGMKVLQFAFSEGSEHLPHYHTKKAVVYTGTHDNDTLKSWAENSPHEVAFAREYLGYGGDIVKLIIRAALASVCDTAIIPMQDWLGKGSEARINTPSVPTGNWKWRMKQGDLDENLAQKMRRLDRIYGRIRV